MLRTCPKLWCNPCSKCYGMDCFGTYFAHVQSCDVTRVQSATEWTASVHTSHMSTKLWCNPCSNLWCSPLDDHEWKRIGKGIKTWIIKDESGCSALKNKKSNVFFYRLSVVKSSFPYSETPIFPLESWPCHTKYMCINIRAFQKYHRYHVSGSRTKNYKKKKRGTRKGAVSAGYLVFQGW